VRFLDPFPPVARFAVDNVDVALMRDEALAKLDALERVWTARADRKSKACSPPERQR
jgi:hypothetical protein